MYPGSVRNPTGIIGSTMNYTPTSSSSRQEWLEKAVYNFRLHFSEHGYTVPDNIRISVGIPKGMHGSKKAIGQCWSPKMSSDGFYELFVSPELGKEKDVLETIAHEMIHATVGIEAGHKGTFKTCAMAVGFIGPMTSTPAGDGMLKVCQAIINSIGYYPAGSLDISQRKKKKTYMIKCECGICGYVVRTTAQWLAMGDPICPVDNVGMN